MRKGEERWIRWSDGTMHQVRCTGVTQHGWAVTYLTGDWKGRPALIEKETFSEMERRAR